MQQLLDTIHDLIEAFCRYRSLLTGLSETQGQFVSIEINTAAITLYDQIGDLFDSFVGRIAPSTSQTLSSSPYGTSILALSRVDDAVAIRVAEWTLHLGASKVSRQRMVDPALMIELGPLAVRIESDIKLKQHLFEAGRLTQINLNVFDLVHEFPIFVFDPKIE